MKDTSTPGLRHRSQLLDERNRLRGLLEDLRAAATSRGDYEPHDVTDDEAAVQADVIEGRIVDIDGALERIESGVYGLCLACGTAITGRRLEALPATTMCRGCAGRHPGSRAVMT
jgi:RNA polymerase-binding transcription factor DksA